MNSSMKWHGELLNSGGDYKTRKGNRLGIVTAILYLIPDSKLCPLSIAAGCREVCLVSAGRGSMSSVERGRLRKTKLFYSDPAAFVDTLARDITKFIRWADKRNMVPAIRLNGTSDITWENVRGTSGKTLMEIFPDVTFYDYTKRIKRTVPSNYDLTFSYSPRPEFAKNVSWARQAGMRFAVVFEGRTLPAQWDGRTVIDGDAHDVRFLDAPGSVIGLLAKGKAKKGENPLTVPA